MAECYWKMRQTYLGVLCGIVFQPDKDHHQGGCVFILELHVAVLVPRQGGHPSEHTEVLNNGTLFIRDSESGLICPS